MLLSVIIPVYNSERTIFPLVECLTYELSAYDFEIVLVNDGSRDASEDICETLTQTFEQVQFVSLRKNFGEFHAVMCGLNHARGEYCVIIDDDFQNPPQEIIKLLREAQQGDYDVVYSQYDKKEHVWFRNVGSWLVNRLTTWLLRKPSDLYLSSFKLLRQEIVQEIIQYNGPYPYLDGLIFRTTRNVGRVTVQHEKRQEGGSNYTVQRLISLFLTILFGYSVQPLRLLTTLGIFMIGFSVVAGLAEIVGSLLTQHLPLTDHLIWLTVCLCGGIQLFGMGLLGEYVGRLFMMQSGLPQYVIKSEHFNYDRKSGRVRKYVSSRA
ncbi:glycosyltransferase family 2 protein [Larkinella rosea]|uniref:Glycosyltransferase n=1 Tax=Larkinella rosea TaxID=2025312 RepID=A0A3P1BBE9_9BACT|nr:glycosyltransferase family 2 protein [Larkinella rosea]RRA97953.1 glycosyltransferase [Larkinella rosea]